MIGSFNIKPGTSSEELALRRKMAAQLAQQGTSTEPVGHWTQGLARALQGGLGGLEMAQISKAEGAERDKGNQLLAQALGGQGGANPELIQQLLGNRNTAGIGQKLVADRLTPAKPPNSMREFELAQSNPAFAQFLDRKRPQTNVNVKNMGTIPPGFRVEYDEQGRPTQMVPIEGSPAAREIAAGQKADETARSQKEQAANIVVDAIDRADKMIESSPMTTTGVGGALLSKMPATTANDVRALLDTVKANAGFDRLQQMREASKTGGALGQVSERELAFLQSTIGNLEQSQTTGQLRENMQKVREAYDAIVNGGEAHKKLFGAKGGESRKSIGGKSYFKQNGQWFEE